MTFSLLSLKARKITAAVLHLLFLAIALVGISTMYINDNFGVGITRVKAVSFEKSNEFYSQFNSDLDDIFQYVRYLNVFSDNGTVSANNHMLTMMYGPTDRVDYSLQDLIVFLQSRGYSLSDDFVCTQTGTARGSSAANRDGYVIWSAASPEITVKYMSEAERSTLENAALKIMSSLNRYYTVYSRFIVNPGNFLFRICYTDPNDATKQTVFTNAGNLTTDNIRSFGAYVYLPGNSVFYETNLPSISLSTIPALASFNPYGGSNYYLLAAVDTNYPAADYYSLENRHYTAMQDYYIAGFVLMIVGFLVAALTLIYLIRIAGREDGRRGITLYPIDRNHTETGIALFSAAACAAYLFSRFILYRLVHLTFPSDNWPTMEKASLLACLYLCALIAFFSMLRRYKAGVLWKNSFLNAWQERMHSGVIDGHEKARASVAFFGFVLVNIGLISLIWLLLSYHLTSKILGFILTGIIAVILIAFDLWIFSGIFRRAAEMHALVDAVDRISAGETNYKMNTDGFDGPELALADGINSISDGLEAALQEKVRSERLKTDLITNVSHDIKTPLTSIINYVDLIKRENIENPKVAAYLRVLDQKSQRLKTLTEDLVEASKASSGNIHMDMMPLDIVELVFQTNGEFEDRLAARNLHLIMNAPEEPLMILADGRSLWRVIENLYTNVCKYALEGSRVYVDVVRKKADLTEIEEAAREASGAAVVPVPDKAVFTIKNISTNQLNIAPDELTERFVRGDVSRTTEGSGLGLSIAKSLTELMHGSFRISIDGDLFKAQVAFAIAEPEKKPAPEETAEDAAESTGSGEDAGDSAGNPPAPET